MQSIDFFKIYFKLIFSGILFSSAISANAAVDSSLYFESPPHEQIIQQFRDLGSSSRYAKLIPYGETDGGQIIHLFVITKTAIFDPGRLHELGIITLFINNGIHPGEPDGINASLLLANKLLSNEGKDLPEHVAICIVPVLNIEGSLERGCCSRVNQNGPGQYGFRANGQYLDLNRDFIKADSQNILSWIKIFRQWDPEVLIDTHVSDGADYQYSISLISSQYNKLYPIQGDYIKNKLSPYLFKKMKEKGSEMCHYVETFTWDLPPDSGILAFLETPRFGTGYAALFNTFGFISESHMLKPFPQRVKATELLLHSLVEMCEEKHQEIASKKLEARKENQFRTHFPINWKLDTSKSEMITFKGYEHSYIISKVTGLNRLHYAREKPFEKRIKYFSSYTAQDTVEAPLYYLIPQAWKKAIHLLHANKIRLIQVEQDSSTIAGVYYIDEYKTVDQPYEGHYLHRDTKVRIEQETIKVNKGDYLVPVFQEGSRYLIETLEPNAIDSYFNWGFFDGILQQKEWFSAYAFEDLAFEILSEDADLKNKFEALKRSDPAFSANSFSQLYFIYKNSKYFEKGLKRYPVYRIGSMSDVLK